MRIHTKSLESAGDAAILHLAGEVDAWTCLENPVPETYWDPNGCKGKWPWGGEYSFGCPKTRPGSPIKNKTATQPFKATLPIYLRKLSDTSAALVMGPPDVQLGGQFVAITNAILHIAGININDEAKKAMEKAIDPDKLAFAIPAEYKDLNPKIESATFRTVNNRLTGSTKLSARLPAEKLNELVRGLVSGLNKK